MTAVQFVVQLSLTAAALLLPGLLAFNLGRPRLSIGWQLALLLAIAAALSGTPWTG